IWIGYAETVHIQSHNNSSSVESYGGVATSVRGISRDIISNGSRPIALLDALRFAPLKCSSNSEWLFRNVVKGIGDYGNCIGVPTVAGEIEFDPSFSDYCLVDVASIGLGRRDSIVRNTANFADLIILVGGSTGRNG